MIPIALQQAGEIRKYAGALLGLISRFVDEVLEQSPADV